MTLPSWFHKYYLSIWHLCGDVSLQHCLSESTKRSTRTIVNYPFILEIAID
ncbi:hypothetical protein ACRRTK_003720 [Alexandromys fortis]